MSKLRELIGTRNGRSEPVSKLSKLVRKVAPIASLIPGPIGRAAKAVGTAFGAGRAGAQAMPGGGATMMALPALPAIAGIARAAGPIVRSLPGLGRAGGAIARGGRAAVAGGRQLVRKYPKSARALAELGLFAAGGIVFDAATGEPVGVVSRRRMNPLNHRALRRAISRVKSAKKICSQVERIAGPRRRASAPCPPRRRKC